MLKDLEKRWVFTFYQFELFFKSSRRYPDGSVL